MHKQILKMRTFIVGAMAIAFISGGAFSQKSIKSWKEWNRKDAEKILNESPWSQTQSERQGAQSSDVPTNMGDTRGREEAVRNVTSSAGMSFRVRFFTARPVRQAYVRLLQLAETRTDAAANEKMEAWANLAADDRIIVTVACSGDERSLATVLRTLRSAKLEAMRNAVYLERKDGKRVAVADYTPPAQDVFGARFIFPRTLDGQPFVSLDSGTIQFHAEYDPKLLEAAAPATTGQRTTATTNNRAEQPYKLRIDMKFKIAEMIYNGELEY